MLGTKRANGHRSELSSEIEHTNTCKATGYSDVHLLG